MTLQREQIDTLLAEIDGVLSKANPRLPWVMSSEVTQQRQTLERIRNYLKGLQSEPGVSSLEPAYQPWGEVVPHTNLEVSAAPRADWIESANSPQAALNLSQQMMQAFTQDLVQLRSSFLQPLQAETTRLQQQRDSLLQEVRQLERQRQQHTLIQQRAGQEQQVYEFLQGLMDRLQERLSQQIHQMVGTIAAGSGHSAITPQPYPADALVLDSIPGGTPLFPAEAGLPPLAPAQRVEQLQMLQARADQIMVTLDTTLRAFAEALQQNIQSYESSLNQGLEKMHTMGQQGEAIVANLVQKLADQVSGQVISGALPSPSRSGNRTQGFSTQGFNASLPDRQHFTTYASPESDRAVNRFKLSGSTSPSAPASGSAPASAPGSAATSAATSAPVPAQYPPVSKATPHPDQRDNPPADLTQTALDPAQTDLELDLELLEQLEQSSDSEPTESVPLESKPEEPQAGNEELDAFYASLFGDTNRKAGSLDTTTQLSDIPAPDIPAPEAPDSSANLRFDAPDVAIDGTLADFDPLAEDFGDEAAELLDLDLEEEPSDASSVGLPHLEVGRAAQTSPAEAIDREWESSMDPLAALSLSLQIPFQGVTEINPALQQTVTDDTVTDNMVTNGAVTNGAVMDDTVTDPLMADLEEALQAFGAPDFDPNPRNNDVSSPESLTIAETPETPETSEALRFTGRTRPPSVPEQPGSESIPVEDIISTLTELLVPDRLPTEGIPLQNDAVIASGTPTPLQEVNPTQSLIPLPASPIPSDQAFEEAGPEESLLVLEEVEGSAPVELYLEPETLHQLKEDLSKLEHQAPEDAENFFDFGTGDAVSAEETLGAASFSEGMAAHLSDKTVGENTIEGNNVERNNLEENNLGEDIFGEDIFGAEFGDSIPTPEIPEPSQSRAASIAPPVEEEDLWEASPPDESLLPEAEDHSLDWLAIQTGPEPSSLSANPVSSPNLSFDLLGNAAFGGGLEEDLDLDSSFEEDNELSLDRMTDWFAEEPNTPGTSTGADAEESLLIDHLFADLPDAEKKNDWPI